MQTRHYGLIELGGENEVAWWQRARGRRVVWVVCIWGMEGFTPNTQFNAVVDDFGNLVGVLQVF